MWPATPRHSVGPGGVAVHVLSNLSVAYAPNPLQSTEKMFSNDLPELHQCAHASNHGKFWNSFRCAVVPLSIRFAHKTAFGLTSLTFLVVLSYLVPGMGVSTVHLGSKSVMPRPAPISALKQER